MSLRKSGNSQQKSQANSKLKSSIVHKPFTTGTINISNPYRHKSNKSIPSKAPRLYLNAQLESLDELELETELNEPEEVEDHDSSWLNSLLNPWSISAIAIILLANLVSAAVIWRDYRLKTEAKDTTPIATLGRKNLTGEEFIPLNLSTLSIINNAEKIVEESSTIEPISPALAPINSSVALSSANSSYYYILTEYTGDRSLTLARQQVKQVSLVNFPQGVFIYLGAFTNRDQADEFVSQLELEELTARVYPFD